MKEFQNKLLRSVLGVAVLLFLASPAVASAQSESSFYSPAPTAQTQQPAGAGGGAAGSGSSSSKAGVCEGVKLVTGASCDNAAAQGEAEDKVKSTVQLVVNILSWIVGVAAVIMIIIGGFKYITSSGDTGNVTSAKNTIMFAVVGLVVVALAQVIVTFVIDKVS